MLYDFAMMTVTLIMMLIRTRKKDLFHSSKMVDDVTKRDVN